MVYYICRICIYSTIWWWYLKQIKTFHFNFPVIFKVLSWLFYLIKILNGTSYFQAIFKPPSCIFYFDTNIKWHIIFVAYVDYTVKFEASVFKKYKSFNVPKFSYPFLDNNLNFAAIADQGEIFCLDRHLQHLLLYSTNYLYIYFNDK